MQPTGTVEAGHAYLIRLRISTYSLQGTIEEGSACTGPLATGPAASRRFKREPVRHVDGLSCLPV
jgi:hypothetical protein